MSHTAPPTLQPLARRGLPPAALALLLLAALTGCNGSRFGDNLSRSFSTPAPATTAANPATSGGAAGNAKAGPAAGSGPAAPSTSGTARPAAAAPEAPAASPANSRSSASRETRPPGTATSTSVQPGASGGNTATPAGNPVRTAPYRVTILLPQADAAAPAEVVTQALRAAGVPFEVETIERQGRSAAPEAPVSRPAPAPR